MGLRRRVKRLESESWAEDDAQRQMLIQVASVENDDEHREPGIYRREAGGIEWIIFRDDEERERLIASVRGELHENLTIIEIGPDVVPRPIDEQHSPYD